MKSRIGSTPRSAWLQHTRAFRWRRKRGELAPDEWRLVVDASPSALLMVDGRGRITLVNSQAERLFGYTRAELLGQPVEQLVPERYRAQHSRHRAGYDAHPTTRSMGSGRDLFGLRKDGSEVPVEIGLNPVVTREGVFVLAAVIDLSERKRAEVALGAAHDELERRIEERTSALSTMNRTLRDESHQRQEAEIARRESDQRMRLATEATHVGIWEWNVITGKIRWDEQMFRIYGISPTADGFVTYDDWRGGVLPEDVSRQEEILQDTVRRLGRSTREFRIRRRDDGQCRIVQAVETVRASADGAAEWVVGTNLDVTERWQAEEALQAAHDVLEARVLERTAELRAKNEELRVATERAQGADRLKSAFLATMSHELRTPLNSIIGFTGILLQRLAGPLTAEQSKQLEMVQGSSRHLLALISDVLDLSKIEAGQLEVSRQPFDLRASLANVTNTVRPLAEAKGLALNVELSPAAGEVVSDQRRVEQVVLNLLSNAVKFTTAGSVTLRAEVVTSDTDSLRPVVRVSVADTGMGIKAEDLGLLFRPFHQIDSKLSRKHEGTGLGLAISRKLAEKLGGTLSFESEWERGSTFTFTLPIDRAPA